MPSKLRAYRDLDRRKLFREVAREHGLLISAVEEIVESQFAFLAETMKKGNLDAVRLPHLGNFRVHPGRIKRLKYISKKE